MSNQNTSNENTTEWTESLQLIRNLRREQEEKMRKALMVTEFIRPEILEFASAMELTMRIHDNTKGNSWKHCELSELCEKLNEEQLEFYEEFSKSNRITVQVLSELVDIGNVAMMIWNRDGKYSGGNEK